MVLDLQENIIHEIVGVLPNHWEKVAINIEIDSIDGEIVISPKSKYFIQGNIHEFSLEIDATDGFEELREEMKKNDAQHSAWTICDLEILNDGTFNYKFSYEEAPRLASLRES